MAESSRDTAQLIRLVYASVCREGWGGVKRDGAKKYFGGGSGKEIGFFLFEDYFLLIE